MATAARPKVKVIDIALRCARANPDVMAYAYKQAARLDVPVDDLLADAICRLRSMRLESPRGLNRDDVVVIAQEWYE